MLRGKALIGALIAIVAFIGGIATPAQAREGAPNDRRMFLSTWSGGSATWTRHIWLKTGRYEFFADAYGSGGQSLWNGQGRAEDFHKLNVRLIQGWFDWNCAVDYQGGKVYTVSCDLYRDDASGDLSSSLSRDIVVPTRTTYRNIPGDWVLLHSNLIWRGA